MFSEDQSQIRSVLEDLANSHFKHLRDDILNAIQTAQSEAIEFSFTEISAKLSILVDKAEEQAKLDVLGSLDSGITKNRMSSISENLLSTFEWIFAADHLLYSSDNFRDWLQSNSNIYWVSGQPGSGKSTLMRYIVGDPRTKWYLQDWAGQDGLSIASYFLWNAGGILQKSLQGLLQSLLYDILSENPALIRTLCPSRFNQLGARHTNWTQRELIETFKRLSTELVSKRFCFFVDGLDEFDGDHMDIIRTLRDLVSSPRIKLCFSSRPWTIFLNAFPKTQRLILEHNTKPDIKTYVDEKFTQDECYLQLARSDERYKKFPRQIVENANGVFLWVVLVVSKLLRGIGNTDDFVELQKRLHFLLRNLGEYYERALNRIDEFYKEDTAQILQLISAGRRPLSMATLTVYELGKSANDPFANKLHTYTKAELDVAYNMCCHHLHSRCQDFVSVKNQSTHWLDPRHTVDFLHGTVTEFLGTSRMKTRLAASSGKRFNARRCLLEATLTQINFMNNPENRSMWKPNQHKNQVKKLIEHFVGYVRDSELLEGISHSALLDDFDRVVQKHIDIVEPFCGHWANSSYFDRGADMQIGYSKNQASNLLVFSIQEDLQLYVTRKLDNEPQLIRRREGRPLLVYALGKSLQDYRKSSTQFSHGCSAGMIRLLLQRGAQSYEIISDEYILYGMTLGVTDWFFRSLYFQKYRPTEYQCHVTSLLLEYAGRSMFSSWHIPIGGEIELYPQRLTVLQIIRHVFHPDKAAELEDLIIKSSWYRIQRQWVDSPWGSGITVLHFFIVDTIRLHYYFTRWLSTGIFASVTSSLREPQKHTEHVGHEVPDDIYDELPMKPILAITITLILMDILIWLSMLFCVYKQFMFVTF